jgi:hypothetical protein
MTGLAFDTHAFVKRLTTAAMPETQAEAARHCGVSCEATSCGSRSMRR